MGGQISLNDLSVKAKINKISDEIVYKANQSDTNLVKIDKETIVEYINLHMENKFPEATDKDKKFITEQILKAVRGKLADEVSETPQISEKPETECGVLSY